MAATATLLAKVGGTSTTTVPSGTLNTSGYTKLLVGISYGAPANSGTPTSVTDNKSNTYTRVDSSSDGVSADGTSNSRAEWWLCETATGGTGHVITATFSGNTEAVVYFIGISGAASTALHVHNVQALAGNPWTVTPPTLTSANALILVLLAASGNGGTTDDSGYAEVSTPAWTEVGVENNSNAYWSSAVYTKHVSATGSYSASIGTATYPVYNATAASLVLLDATATVATLSSPTATSITNSAATLGATTDQGTAGSNNAYAVWSTSNGFSGVTATQVKAGQNAAGSTSGVSNSGAVAITTTSPTIPLTGLSASTTYYYAIVQNNANGDSNVLTGSFTTSATLRSTSVNFRDSSNAAVASTSIAWFLTSSWGGSVLESGTTSTNGSGALLLSGLTSAAGAYKLFYKLASDENLNGMRPVTLV